MMSQNNLKIKGPKGKEIDLTSTVNILKAFSQDTVYAAALDIIFSLELSRKEDYKSFVEELVNLINERGARTRLEQALIKQIKILQNRKPQQKQEERDISQVFTSETTLLDNLSNDLKLQLDITNYILEYFKKGNFSALEQCLDVLIEKSVLMNTVKNFLKKEIDFFIAEKDSESIKRLSSKYSQNPQLWPVIKEQLDTFLQQRKQTSQE